MSEKHSVESKRYSPYQVARRTASSPVTSSTALDTLENQLPPYLHAYYCPVIDTNLIEVLPVPTSERKLFVGLLSKKCNESDVRDMFENFGPIEDCTILRDGQGASKGCAFVTYKSTQSAINAIGAMHQSYTMNGCASPIVVKFADNQRNHHQAKLQQMHSNLWDMASSMNFSPQSYLTTAALNQQFASNINDCSAGLTPLQIIQQQLQTSMALPNVNKNLSGLLFPNNPQSMSSDILGLCSNVPDTNAINLQRLAMLANLPASSTMNTIPVQNLISLAALTGGPSALSNLSNSTTATTGFLNNRTNSINASTSSLNGLTSTINATGRQIEGPEGANLFIYHLPQEFTDLHLLCMFSPFGNVISTKVYIDKNTNLSKCFGFVSYDNALSAQKAIARMNCYQIGSKRLKVQLKRPKDSSRTY